MADLTEIRHNGYTVRVEGLRQVQRKLRAAGADAEDMRDLMHTLGLMVIDGAHPPARTGRLAGNLRAGKGKTKAVVRAGGARVPYAGVIHYGWPARGIRAQPYLTDALQARKQQVYAALERGLDDILARNGLN